MIRVECKLTGEVIETKAKNWRIALNCAKYYGLCEEYNFSTKASDFINNLKLGYEDQYIKAYII